MYDQTKDPCYRGIQVLDKNKMERIINTPFYHNKLLNEHDILCNGNYKKSIRLLKTIKADSKDTEDTYGEIELSSYDIAAILYHMEAKNYRIGNSPLLLVQQILIHLLNLYNDNNLRTSLKVPDQSRHIFGQERSTTSALETLIDHVQRIIKIKQKVLTGLFVLFYTIMIKNLSL